MVYYRLSHRILHLDISIPNEPHTICLEPPEEEPQIWLVKNVISTNIVATCKLIYAEANSIVQRRISNFILGGALGIIHRHGNSLTVPGTLRKILNLCHIVDVDKSAHHNFKHQRLIIENILQGYYSEDYLAIRGYRGWSCRQPDNVEPLLHKRHYFDKIASFTRQTARRISRNTLKRKMTTVQVAFLQVSTSSHDQALAPHDDRFLIEGLHMSSDWNSPGTYHLPCFMCRMDSLRPRVVP